jgi:hypothetical protein
MQQRLALAPSTIEIAWLAATLDLRDVTCDLSPATDLTIVI